MSSRIACLLLSGLASGYSVADVQFLTGVDYSEGKYGSQVTTQQTSVPLVAKYEAERWSGKLSIPYVWIKNVNPNSQGESLPCGNAVQTPKDVDGFGDFVASASYSVYSADGFLVDLGAKAKFATADADKCLSSGKNDYSISADVVQQLGQITVFGTLGLTKKGDPEFLGQRIDYDDPVFASLGASYKLSNQTSVGASYDYRQQLTEAGSEVSEASAFVSQKIDNSMKVQGYLVAGFSDASPDFGVGVLVSRRY